MAATKWTAAQIPNLSDKVVVVTGANSGIGYYAAKEFARNGAQTILACRNPQKAQKAAQKIRGKIPHAAVQTLQLNLASLKSIHAFSDQICSQYDRLDILLNNAGIMMVPYGVTEDGFESQFGTNHLGHFALTGLLLEVLTQTPGARVVTVSSLGHRSGQLDFENLMLQKEQTYSPAQAYSNAKLANLIFAYELQRRLEARNLNASSMAAHPGFAATNLVNHLVPSIVVRILAPVFWWMVQSSAMGALPSLRAAVDPNVSGGQYFGPGNPGEHRGYPIVVDSNSASHDRHIARQLWAISEELTGIRYLSD